MPILAGILIIGLIGWGVWHVTHVLAHAMH